jgi:hypothetical protein
MKEDCLADIIKEAGWLIKFINRTLNRKAHIVGRSGARHPAYLSDCQDAFILEGGVIQIQPDQLAVPPESLCKRWSYLFRHGVVAQVQVLQLLSCIADSLVSMMLPPQGH